MTLSSMPTVLLQAHWKALSRDVIADGRAAFNSRMSSPRLLRATLNASDLSDMLEAELEQQVEEVSPPSWRQAGSDAPICR